MKLYDFFYRKRSDRMSGAGAVWMKMLFPSLTQQLLGSHHVPCPVLTCRSDSTAPPTTLHRVRTKSMQETPDPELSIPEWIMRLKQEPEDQTLRKSSPEQCFHQEHLGQNLTLITQPEFWEEDQEQGD